jgi:hypothetical protein
LAKECQNALSPRSVRSAGKRPHISIYAVIVRRTML